MLVPQHEADPRPRLCHPQILHRIQTDLEKVLLITSLVLVILVELVNSAIEAVVDRSGLEYNELSGRAKDIGSAAVFVSLLFVVFVWAMLLL